MTGYIAEMRKLVGHRTLIQCAASVICLDDQGRILLGRRKDNRMWGYSGGSVEVADAHVLFVLVPKEDAMEFDTKQILGQVMYMTADGLPNATKIFKVSVDELLKEDGYGD